MSSLLNSSQLTQLSGIFQSHFETFSTGINNYCTVVKEPIKNIINTNSNYLPGYNVEDFSNTDITYTENVRTFPCMRVYPKDIKNTPLTQMNTSVEDGTTFIKVKEDCKDFIINGKTERIELDGQKFNTTTEFNVQNFFGLRFYYFKLTQTL